MSIHILTTEQLAELLREQIKITAEFYSSSKIIQDEIMKSPVLPLTPGIEVPTDEEIEDEFTVIGNDNPTQMAINAVKQEGAKWMRDKLLTHIIK